MKNYRILALGAHPDDCEIFCGGWAVRMKQAGHAVKFVSMTNGDAGHFRMSRNDLRQMRLQETQQAGAVAGIEYQVLDNHDGELLPTLENRLQVIRLIRDWQADVVLSHRPWDYHPDHRYTGILVQDAAYMVTVPLLCPEIPALEKNPVFLHFWDSFTKPYPFQPYVAVSVDEQMETKWRMLHCHQSQFYEWLAYQDGDLENIPEDDGSRLEWLKQNWSPFLQTMRQCCSTILQQKYGADAERIQFVEAFELCEYGRRPDNSDIKAMFEESPV